MSVESVEALKCLSFLKDESVNDIACFKNSVTTKTLYQLYFANFDTIEQALLKAQETEKENTKYKQLEEQVGCPLEVFVKALKNGIWCQFERNKREKMFYCPVLANGEYFLVSNNRENDTYIYFNDYKITWWLREDKSE